MVDLYWVVIPTTTIEREEQTFVGVVEHGK